MDTTTNQWPQGICLVKPLHHHNHHEGSKLSTAAVGGGGGGGGVGVVERKARPQKEQALNCPRCNSTNTKFCYYNNYSLSQPRYFCKTCRRYWTEGGTLRNVPVGGGSRKNKRSSSSSTTSSTITSTSSPKNKHIIPDLTIFNSPPLPHHQNQNPNNINNKIHLLQGVLPQDLNLPQHHHLPLGVDHGLFHFPNFMATTSKTTLDSTNLPAALELLKAADQNIINSTSGGITSSLISSLTMPPPPPVVSDSVNNPIYYYYHHSHDDDHHRNGDVDDDRMKQQHPPAAKLFNFASLHSSSNGYHEEEEEDIPAAPAVVQDQDKNSSTGRRVFLPYEELLMKPVSNDHQYHHHHQEEEENRVHGESNGYWNGMLGGSSTGSSW